MLRGPSAGKPNLPEGRRPRRLAGADPAARMGAMKRLFLPLGILLAAVASAQVDRIDGRPFATRSVVLAQHGMVCTSQPLATQIGVDILKAGGSAVDAAIAANAALGLMEPMMDGVGGDLFAIVYDARTKKLYGLNASGRSPLGLSLEQMRAEAAKAGRPDHIPPHGFLPISVPGAVSGWFELHGRFGKLPIKDDLAPAIRYAQDGFPVPQYIAGQWAGAVEDLGKLKLSRRLPRSLRPRGPRAGRGRGFPQSGPGADPGPDRRAGPRRLLPGRDRGGDRRLHAGQRRLPAHGRL